MLRNRNCMGLLLRVGVVICLAILISALASTGASGFTVNSTADDDDMSCDPLSVGDCTLREAIRAVNDGLGKKIDFDPATFPPGVLTPIMVGSAYGTPLAAIRGSGTTVDGSGTGVVIDGSTLGAVTAGLAFRSDVGTALANVTVRSIVVQFFNGIGVYICGGVPSGCSDPLSRTTVSHVTAIGNTGRGILLDGSKNDWATVKSSYAEGNSDNGITILAEGDINKALVSDCTVVGNSLVGIYMNSGSNNLKAKLTDNTASRNGLAGIHLNAINHTIKPKLTGNTISDNRWGIIVDTGGNMEMPKFSENHAAGNSSTGIWVNSGDDFLGGQLKDNVLSGNDGYGIYINGRNSLVKVKLQDNRAVNNTAHGIWLEGSSNQVKNNVASDNGGDGIFLDGLGQGNKVQGNQATGNIEAGIRVGTNSTNAQIKKNDARGNSTDLVDDNTGCDANMWQSNAFVTRNRDCIE